MKCLVSTTFCLPGLIWKNMNQTHDIFSCLFDIAERDELHWMTKSISKCASHFSSAPSLAVAKKNERSKS